MDELTLAQLFGQWFGEIEQNERNYDLKIGASDDLHYGIYVSYLDRNMKETRNLILSDLTDNNSRVLFFSEDFSLEIKHYQNSVMTIEIGGEEKVFVKRQL